MKKYFLNPADIFLGIFSMVGLCGIFITLLISLVIEWISKRSLANILEIAVVLFSILLLLMVLILCYMNKYWGWIYLDNNHLILKKGKKQVALNITDIRWIELKYDVRSGIKGGIHSKKGFRFFIKLNNYKENLDFIITNHIILDIIKKHNIRIMPDQYNQIYINTGKFDFDCKKKRKSKNK